MAVDRVLLAAPRGFCAGVEMAIKALAWMVRVFEPPVYCYHEIVHNRTVVDRFRALGVEFVDDVAEVPDGAPLMLSAHGSAPEVVAAAQAKGGMVVDAVCPLVTKVHHEVKVRTGKGYTVVYVGHEGHDEAVGTMAVAPDAVRLVETEADVDALEVADPSKVAYISQTTLSVDETRAIIERLRAKFPAITGPRTDDICYATTNRQAAVKQMAAECDLVLVIGSQNSSNSQRLVEVARDYGADSYLIDNESQVQDAWLDGKRVVGISSGASAPEELVSRLVAFFTERGVTDVAEYEVVREDVRFMLPKRIREDLAAATA